MQVISAQDQKKQRLSSFEVLYTFLQNAPETRYRKERAVGFLLRKRVIMLSPEWYIVESKKYPNEPSVFHKVHVTTAHQIVMCDCEHVQFRGKLQGLCAHSLAVALLMAVVRGESYDYHTRESNDINSENPAENVRQRFDSKILFGDNNVGGACLHCKVFGVIFTHPLGDPTAYRCEKCGFVFTPERLQRLVAFNMAYSDMKITGTEYFPHIRNKRRIRDLLDKHGFVNLDYEYMVHCRNPHTDDPNKYPYFLDVYGEKVSDGRVIAVGIEVHGKKGHGSKITIPQDRNRKEEIETQLGIHVVEFWIENLETARDEDIMEEIYQALGL